MRLIIWITLCIGLVIIAEQPNKIIVLLTKLVGN